MGAAVGSIMANTMAHHMGIASKSAVPTGRAPKSARHSGSNHAPSE